MKTHPSAIIGQQLKSTASNIIATTFKIIFLVLLLPLFVIFVCPIYIARLCVFSLSKIVRPDLATILPVRDMFYAVDDINTNPKSSIVATIVSRGRMQKEVLIRNVECALTQKRNGSKDLLYPELKRYLVKFMGFFFWKEDTSFSAENHVMYIDAQKFSPFTNKIIDEEALKQIEKYLVQEPYPEKRSPWCIKILQNYRPREFAQNVIDCNGNRMSESDECSAVIFKVHHSFVDGFSLLNLVMKDIMQCPTSQLSLPTFPKRNRFQNFLLNLLLIFKAPYDTLTEALMDNDHNPWYLTKENVTNVINTATSYRIPTQKIKNLAKIVNGSFTSVIISAISGGIRRHMLERGDKIDPKMTFSCLAPFPVQGHPETLGNYLSDCYLSFPVAVSDSLERIKLIERQLYEIKNSTISLSSFVMQPIFGGLFHWMVKPLVEFAMSKSSGIFSSFPCPRVALKGPGGDEIVDVAFVAGHDSPGIGIQFLAVNYAGGWKLKIQADSAILSSDAEVERLLKCILLELDSFQTVSNYDDNNAV